MNGSPNCGSTRAIFRLDLAPDSLIISIVDSLLTIFLELRFFLLLLGGLRFPGGSGVVVGDLDFGELALAKRFYELQLLDREAVLEVHQAVNVFLEHLADIFICGGLVPLVTSFIKRSDLICTRSLDGEWEFH